MRSLQKALNETTAQLAELTSLRLRRLLTDDEFVVERDRLAAEQGQLQSQLAQGEDPSARFEPVREVISARNYAVDWFQRGGDDDKRLIFETVGSNPCLAGGILNVEAAKPFVRQPPAPEILRGCRLVEEVRTPTDDVKPLLWQFIKDTRDALDDPEGARLLANLKTLQERMATYDLSKAA